MEKRLIGNSGLEVSAIGLGCMGMSEFYGAHDDAESLATLERAFELGVTFFDTADMYGAGHNEQLLSRFLKGKRDRIVLATKFGIVREDSGYGRRIDNSPDYIRKAVDASLSRLGTDTIDLYYAHRLERGRPVEEIVDTLAGLSRPVRSGRSACRRSRRKPCAAPRPFIHRGGAVGMVALDPRSGSNGVLAACRELGTSFVAYSPLGRGFLTGKLDGTEGLAENDFRRLSPRFREENLERNRALVDKVKDLAAIKGVTPGQLVLAWLLAQGNDVVPIPGTRCIAIWRKTSPPPTSV